MANIEAQLNTIRKAENGESVRDAIADAIDAVNRDGAVTLTKLTATHNGRWKAGEGLAYKEVSVNVEGGGSSNISMESFKVDVDTAPGEYKASEVIGEGKAWDTVIVDIDSDLSSKLGEVTINEDGTYLPEDYGYSGFNKVIVASTPTGDGPFTVNFWGDKNKTVLKQTQIVQKGGNAIYTGEAIPPTMEGYFVGWNPTPSYVTRDMDCVPIYSSVAPTHGTIPDEWSVILANKGAPYAIGSYKNIDATISYIIDNKTYSWRIFANICKVASGEQNTTSTWVSTPISYPPGIHSPKGTGEENKSWPRHPLRTFYNQILFPNLAESWKQSIKPVIKHSVEIQKVNGAETPVVVPTQDYLWIPCTKEMYIDQVIPNTDDGSGNSWYYHQGIVDIPESFNNVYTDSKKYASWNVIEESAGFERWITTNDQSLRYAKDYLGNNMSVLNFFRPNSGNLLLRDAAQYSYSYGYGPTLANHTLTINGESVPLLGIRGDFKEGLSSAVCFCFCL